MIQRPLLAASAESQDDLHKLQYPLLLSPKIDGIRCLLHPKHGAVTRQFKPIPNIHVRQFLEKLPRGFDGEVVALTEDGVVQDFNSTQSAVMTHAGKPKFIYYVFDDFTRPNDPYSVRLQHAETWTTTHRIQKLLGDNVLQHLYHIEVKDVDEVMEHYAESVKRGYEGVMLRAPDAAYKNGRSTLKQQILVKYKGLEFSDDEGIVIDFEEKFHNTNEAKTDAFGLTKRSSHKSNLVPANTLGALVLDTKYGTLRVGTGFDDSLRKVIWQNRQAYIGARVTFMYQKHGMKEGGLPRFPSFKGFRSKED